MAKQGPRITYRFIPYRPPGVTEVLVMGASTCVGVVDESTVLKFPHGPRAEMTRLEIERIFFHIIGPHERIIRLKGWSDAGLFLERARNGDIASYIESANPPPSVKQRLAWCREAAEAVVVLHRRRVLHCDIHPLNLLLDDDLHVKLGDFQGRYHSETDEVLVDGWAAEPCRYFCPRDGFFDADVKTDLFALGCTIYFIMMGHEVFPDITTSEEGWRQKVEDRFERQQWPQDQHPCSGIVLKCWERRYLSALEIIEDIKSVERAVERAANREVRPQNSPLF